MFIQKRRSATKISSKGNKRESPQKEQGQARNRRLSEKSWSLATSSLPRRPEKMTDYTCKQEAVLKGTCNIKGEKTRTPLRQRGIETTDDKRG